MHVWGLSRESNKGIDTHVLVSRASDVTQKFIVRAEVDEDVGRLRVVRGEFPGCRHTIVERCLILRLRTD
jgi:hypothetical protein